MIIISQQREKCIGCNYCVEISPERWRMSHADGKSVLVGSQKKKDWYNLRIDDHEYEQQKDAANACPVNIIHVKKL